MTALNPIFVAGPGRCALASENSTEFTILANVDELLFALYDPSHKGLPQDLSLSSSIKCQQ